ncbi:iron-chelate-transporting atpase [Leptolyngbya sp. Heron Island J]|uniref:ABC transporter ATP-binding protein n=1 Tax=Leptolyngbya sp. Heron Island J TaxID=1385935 RepID=UPI0003B9B750|nr:ABC transporter ATP-binding protein [Leptolyngbya sp. Heron Island J]ESA38594.1 iron-chelate-transporting atpase [Leptolyngbya sp. Heron Island J]
MVLETSNLQGGYGDTTIVQQVSLTLHQGEWLSILGANGSGKSTLLRLCGRILSPQQGTIWLSGDDIHSLSPTAVARKLALLPQQQILPAGLSVYQLVSLGRSPHQPWWQWDLTAADHQQIEQALAWTDMEQYRHVPVSALSGGQRQRAFLALALAQQPKVLLLDEPTTYLDIHYQLQLLELLKQLNQKQQLAIITVLHDINLAVRYSDRLALMREGTLWAVGAVADTLTPDIVNQVFDVDVAIVDTPVGPQICPLTAKQSAPTPPNETVELASSPET